MFTIFVVGIICYFIVLMSQDVCGQYFNKNIQIFSFYYKFITIFALHFFKVIKVY